MSQKAAIVDHPSASSKKCSQCGLRNFANTDRCRRCKSDLALSLTAATSNEQMPDNSNELGRSRVTLVVICSAGLALLLCLVFFYMKQDPPPTPEAVTETVVAEAAVPPAEQPQKDPAQQNPHSEEAARDVLAELKLFQGATESSMGYDKYEEMLNHLQGVVDNALPAFALSDRSFALEVEGAVRDYTAAGRWWKTTIRNSSTLSDADRVERTQPLWNSARTHVDNAEKILAPTRDSLANK